MIGKASELKVKFAEAHYEYPPGDYSVNNRKWVSLEDAINTALASLGNSAIVSISYTSQVYGEDVEVNETALIVYKEETHEKQEPTL